MNKLVALGAGAALSLLASTANAAFLSGSFATGQSPGSAVAAVDAASAPTTLDVATGLDFTASATPGFVGSNFIVVGGLGDFAALGGLLGTLADFQFSPALSPSPLDPLWSVGGFTFIADSVSVDDQDANTLTLRAIGKISDGAGGADDTPGIWDFSLNQTSGSLSFSFSTATNVPEPATLALFGAGLLGLGMVRRRKA